MCNESSKRFFQLKFLFVARKLFCQKVFLLEFILLFKLYFQDNPLDVYCDSCILISGLIFPDTLRLPLQNKWLLNPNIKPTASNNLPIEDVFNAWIFNFFRINFPFIVIKIFFENRISFTYRQSRNLWIFRHFIA